MGTEEKTWQKIQSLWDVGVEKNGKDKMGRQSKEWRDVDESWWGETNVKNNKGEEKKFAWTLDEKRMDAMERNVNMRQRGWRRYQMVDNVKIDGYYKKMKRAAENRIEWITTIWRLGLGKNTTHKHIFLWVKK